MVGIGKSGKDASHVVQPRRSWKKHKAACAIVFAAVAIPVYLWGPATSRRPQPAEPFTATASLSVQIPDAAGDADGKSTIPSNFDPGQIKKHITSPANLERALRQVGPPKGQEDRGKGKTGPPARKLQIDAERTSTPGGLKIVINCTDTSPQHCTGLVNALAEQYAAECRAQWQGLTRRALLGSQKALEASRQESLAANARLDAFVEQQFNRREAGPQKPAARAARRTVPAESRLVDNPEWLELSAEFERMRRYRAELLVDRTPLHPQVEQHDLRMMALEDKLLSVPKKISAQAAPKRNDVEQQPPGQSPPQGVNTPGETPPDDSPAERLAAAEKSRELKAAVAQTGRAYDRAVRLERRLWQRHQQEPKIEISRAPTPEPTPAPPRRSAALLAALLAGLASATGVGMIFAGAAMEPTLDSIPQAEAALAVPVVATIPSRGPQRNLALARRRRSILRAAAILAGLILLAGCAAAIVRLTV